MIALVFILTINTIPGGSSRDETYAFARPTTRQHLDNSMANPTEAHIHDVIIVGAGPCGLAIASRLREQCPAAIFTDEEHRRFQWMHRHGNKMALKHVKNKNGRIKPAQQPDKHTKSGSKHDVIVLDADHEDWMGRWNRLFATYEIKQLRSHMLWHVDPNDRDSLLAHARDNGRESELVEMKGCVGKEMSKHAMKARQGKYFGSKSVYSHLH